MAKQENLLESRLNDYAKSKAEYRHCSVSAAFLFTASAAAGLGALICPPPAEAAVKYSGMKNLPMGTNAPKVVHNINLDGDDVDDFHFLFGQYGYHATIGSQQKYLSNKVFVLAPASLNSFIVEQSVTSTSTFSVPARLPNNYTIQGGLPPGSRNWQNGSSSLLAGKFQYYNNTINTTNSAGNFIGKRGYLGVRFQISGDTHYGWIQFAADEDVKNGRIVDWAYEDQPDTPIKAGDGRFKMELFMPAIVNGAKQRLEQTSE